MFYTWHLHLQPVAIGSQHKAGNLLKLTASSVKHCRIDMKLWDKLDQISHISMASPCNRTEICNLLQQCISGLYQYIQIHWACILLTEVKTKKTWDKQKLNTAALQVWRSTTGLTTRAVRTNFMVQILLNFSEYLYAWRQKKNPPLKM